MKKTMLLLLALVLVGCSSTDPRIFVSNETPDEGLALIWFPRALVGISGVNGEELPEIAGWDDYSNKLYVNPGETQITAVRVGLHPNPHRYFNLNFTAEANHTYLIDYMGPQCKSAICVHDAGESLKIPKIAVGNKKFDNILEAALASKIIAINE